MSFPLRRVLDPIAEPVALADMKNYLRVDISDDDALIAGLISLARERAEDLTSCCLLPQQWVFSFDRFPTFGYFSWGHEYVGQHHHHVHSIFTHEYNAIILPRGPVISVDSIEFIDPTGALNVLDPSLYKVDLLSKVCRINPIYAHSWPSAMLDTNSVTVKFTAGFQQTVTENILMPATAPYTTLVSRPTTAVSLTSSVDSVSKVAVPGVLVGGAVTCPSATPNEILTVAYQTTSIPYAFLYAIQLMCSAWYENRSEVIQGGGNFNRLPSPISAVSLLSTQELFIVGYPRT